MSPPALPDRSTLVEHFFRHAYGKLVATLSRRFGVQHLAAIEDAAQAALMTALETWRTGGLPDNPTAWLFKVAHNKLLSELRVSSGRRRLLEAHVQASVLDEGAAPESLLAGEIDDDLLRMLFACCDDALPRPSQLALALKTLCGFSVGEIALRLFTSEANVYKRLARARDRLRQAPPPLDDLGGAAIELRTDAVRQVIYLLFTEGHLSSHAEQAIRQELVEEALRLGRLLAAHAVGQTPTTYALLALMHLHAARLPARADADGGLLLLEEQDRTRWDGTRTEEGMRWLARAAAGEDYTRFHAEAAIAAEHAMAPSFAATRWDKVADAYALLERVAPSPVHTLNRAVAVAEHQGPMAGLAVLERMAPPTWLAGSYLFSAVQADLHRRAGQKAEAATHRRAALAGAPTAAIRHLLERRLDMKA